MWLLGIELRTSGRTASALNHLAISPALEFLLYEIISVFKKNVSASSHLVKKNYTNDYKTVYDSIYYHFIFKNTVWEWRDGSVVKITGCSSRGPEFNSQQPHGGSQPSIMESGVLF